VAQQAAVKAVKRQLQAQGRKVAHFAHREIVAMAKGYIAQHPDQRGERDCASWCAEGVFGKKVARSVQHLKDLHKEERAEPQALPLCEYRDRNGARQ
jgi:hypothetical protein